MLSVVLLGAPITSAVFPGDAHPLVNGSLWTIAYEFRCYLLLALVGMAGLLRRRWVLLAITMILILLPHWKPLKGWLWTGDLAGVGEASMILRLLPFFAVGACFYIFRDLVRFRPRLLWTAIGAMIAIQIVDARHMELGMYVFGSYVIFYLGQCQFTWLQSWRMPDISYGVYLYGWPVESLWIFYRHGSPWVTFVASLVICAALGWLSWHFVERPMLKLKRRPTAVLPAP